MTDVLWQWVADVTVAVFERRMRQRNGPLVLAFDDRASTRD